MIRPGGIIPLQGFQSVFHLPTHFWVCASHVLKMPLDHGPLAFEMECQLRSKVKSHEDLFPVAAEWLDPVRATQVYTFHNFHRKKVS